MDFDELVGRSAALPYAMPTDLNRIQHWADRREEVEEHAGGVRPILHGSVLTLMESFLELKREAGAPPEKALYAGLSTRDFVTRLLARRPLAFLNASDSYLLRDGTQGVGCFDLVGTLGERLDHTLDRLLSYDEMAISALLGVSVPTHFLNAGGRSNRARPGKPGTFEARGVYVGLVGARFERPQRMEWRQMLVTLEQNTTAEGYGPDADPSDPATRLSRAWASFYGLEHLPVYAHASRDTSGRYLELNARTLFDTQIYKQRMRVSVEAFLRDANERARAAGQQAYLHAVGLGLGVWQLHACQLGLLVEVFADALRSSDLSHVADLDFSWFRGASSCGGVRDGELFSAGQGEVRIHFSDRDPAAALEGEDAGKLLVAMYAWDSNSFPGNEYWLGSLSASGDPAAACCSHIPELQNPDVNPRVAGEFARVFDADGSARGISEG